VAPATILAECQKAFDAQFKDPLPDIERCRKAALAQIEALHKPDLLTVDEWQNLRLLPGRSGRGVILFGSGLMAAQNPPSDLHISVIDLVTKVDAAANPVERSTFKYHLVRATP
jgi:hypothetical protein